jgi:hypothetical protein
MKKILIFILMLFLSIQVAFAAACWGKIYYIYENQQWKEFYIPQYSFQNFFRQIPIFEVQDILEKGTHFTIYTSSSCPYEWFENLQEWTFFDYSIWYRLRILWNIGIILWILWFFLSNLLNKRKIAQNELFL